MLHCPACGAANQENAKFCKECMSKLDHSPGLRLGTGDQSLPNAPFPGEHSTGGIDMSTVSLVLGIIGLGIPVVGIVAIFLGANVLRNDKPGRTKAKAGLGLGIVGTVIMLVALGAAVFKKDPLNTYLTPARVPAFTAAVTPRVDRIDEQATALIGRLGPGAEQEMTPVYAEIAIIKDDLFVIDSLVAADTIEDPTMLDSLRQDIVARLANAQELLKGR